MQHLLSQILNFLKWFHNNTLKDVSECVLQQGCCPTHTISNTTLGGESAQRLQRSSTNRRCAMAQERPQTWYHLTQWLWSVNMTYE
jgi:hypothetical protein